VTIKTIYVLLPNEGTDVWAPVSAERLREGTYRIVDCLGEDHDHDHEGFVVLSVHPNSKPRTIVDIQPARRQRNRKLCPALSHFPCSVVASVIVELFRVPFMCAAPPWLLILMFCKA
jgi:hypothetical protein